MKSDECVHDLPATCCILEKTNQCHVHFKTDVGIGNYCKQIDLPTILSVSMWCCGLCASGFCLLLLYSTNESTVIQFRHFYLLLKEKTKNIVGTQ